MADPYGQFAVPAVAPPATVTPQNDPYAQFAVPTTASVAPPASGVLPTWQRVPLGLGAAALAGIGGDLSLIGRGLQWIEGSHLPSFDPAIVAPRVGNLLSAPSQFPSLAPQSGWERTAEGAIRGVTGAAPFALLGPAGTAIPTLAAGAASGATGSGLRALGVPAPLAEGAALGVGLAGAGGASLFGRTSADIMRDLGGARTAVTAGAEVKNAVHNWIENTMPQKVDSVMNSVGIPSDSPTAPDETVAALRGIVTEGGTLQKSLAAMRDHLPDIVYKNLLKVVRKSGGTVPWGDLRSLRTGIGKLVSTGQADKSFGAQNADNIYRALTSDLRDEAHNLGMGDEFDSANAEVHRLHELVRNHFNWINKPETLPETVTNRLAGGKGMASTLQALRQEIPSAADSIATATNPSGEPLALSAKSWKNYHSETREALIPSARDRDILSRAPKPPPRLAHALENLTSMGVGGALGALGAHAPLLHSMVDWPLGATAGFAAPYLYYGARAALRNPFIPLAAARGGQGR